MYHLLILMQLLSTQTVSTAVDQVIVTGDAVCLRAGPSDQKEVVFQVNKGQVLQAFHADGDWIEVVPPVECNVWIHKELVNESIVVASKARIRAGPGINFTYIGKVDKGEKLTVRETKGEWLKIAPPSGCSLWVSSLYADRVKTDQAADTEAALMPLSDIPQSKSNILDSGSVSSDYVKPPMPLPLDAAAADDGLVSGGAGLTQARKTANVPVPAGLPPDSLAPSKPQAEKAKYTGILRKGGIFSRKLTRYRLVRLDGEGRAVELCYVLGNMDQLSGVVGRNMTISGSLYWLKSIDLPVVIPETISLIRQ
jgi:uncharacterized protein YraI